MTQKFNSVAQVKIVEPFALPAHLGQFRVHDSEKLPKVGGSMIFDLLGGEWFASIFAPAGIPQACCPITDYDNGLVSQLLKLAQFAEDNGVAYGKVIVAWVHSKFDTQRFFFFKQVAQVDLFFNLYHAPFQHIFYGFAFCLLCYCQTRLLSWMSSIVLLAL